MGHQGGRRIWQLAVADEYVIAWMVTPEEDSEEVEGAHVREFVAEYGSRPIGQQDERSAGAVDAELTKGPRASPL